MKKTLATILVALCAAISQADYIRQATETYPGGGGGGSPNAVTTNEYGVVEAPIGLTGAYVNNNWFFWFLGGSSVWLYQPTDLHIGGDDYSDGTPLPDYIDARADSQITNAVTSGYLCTVAAAEAMTDSTLKLLPAAAGSYRRAAEVIDFPEGFRVGETNAYGLYAIDVRRTKANFYCNVGVYGDLVLQDFDHVKTSEPGTPTLPNYIDARASAMTNGLLRASDYHGDYITDGINTINANREVFEYLRYVITNGVTVLLYKHEPPSFGKIAEYRSVDYDGVTKGVVFYNDDIGSGICSPVLTPEYWPPSGLCYTCFPGETHTLKGITVTISADMYAEPPYRTVGKLATTNDIPTALKNPKALRFAGAESGEYDGSAEMTVNIPSTPEEVGAYPKAAGEDDHTKVTNLLTYVGGQNVRVSVTNYYGNTSGKLPRLRIEEFTTVTNSGVEVQGWNTVWDEDDKFVEFATNINTSVSSMTNASLNALTSITNDIVNYADATKAPKAWGKYASDGTLAPSDTVVHATSKTMFGAEFKCYTIGANQVGFLIAKNAAGYSGAEPGEFKFYNLSGNHFFGMHIRDEVELGCATDGILITNVGGDTMATLTYNVTMSGKPSIHYTPSLDPGQIAWEKLSQRDGTQVPGASKAVTWEAVTTPGTEVCHINMGSAPKGFYYATIDDPAESWLHTDLVLNAQGGILCTNEFTGLTVNVVPYIDDASNTVKWRVKP